jgi:hypothetical protein
MPYFSLFFAKQYKRPMPVCSLYHCRERAISRFFPRTTHQESSEGGFMTSGFDTWIGQAVVLQVALGDIRVPLRGKLLKDGGDTLRMRIGDGWDIDIYKTMVQAVEEDAMVCVPA